jgi:nicotinamide mononucleotide (NMN) deamidase PncC
MNDTETLSPVLPDETEEATRRLLRKAHERGLMLATAESCTGGMLASLLTDVQGVSHTFEPGLVHFGCARAGRVTAHREEHFGPGGRGATRIACMKVAVAMMAEML